MTIAEEKKSLRKKIKIILEDIQEKDLSKQSELLCSAFLKSDLFFNSDIILSYMSMRKEASPLQITECALQKNKMLCLPKTVSCTNDMNFYKIDSNKFLEAQLEEGAWGIKEPYAKQENLFNIENYFSKNITVIVPGVAFSKEGTRLGHGKGFYDKYISKLRKNACKNKCNVITVGICFNEQIVSHIPEESSDEKMDMLLTEGQLVLCNHLK